MSEKKNESIVSRWPDYQALYRQDPRRYPMEVEEFAAFLQTSKVTIYSWAKKDPRVRAILDAIRAGAGADDPARDEVAASAPAAEIEQEVLDSAALNREMRDLLGLAAKVCKQFVSEHQRHSIEDAPLTAWQLEQTVTTLLRLQREIRPKREEILRRHAGEAQPSLF